MKLDLVAIGISMPGLPDWASARAVLRGEQPYSASELALTPSNLLPPNERRRAPLAVRLAFAAAEDALGHGALDPGQWATVFASSDADTVIIHRIVSSLAGPQRLVSPTDFHNCVHNAAAGYWSIAAGCRLPSTSLSAWDASFAAGLLEAAALALAEELPVLLVAYDLPPPPPLWATRPIAQPAAVALALRAAGSAPGALAQLTLSLEASAPDTPCTDATLEALRLANPAARALPLLQRLASGGTGELLLTAPCGSLRVQLQ